MKSFSSLSLYFYWGTKCTSWPSGWKGIPGESLEQQATGSTKQCRRFEMERAEIWSGSEVVIAVGIRSSNGVKEMNELLKDYVSAVETTSN